jgi:phosphoribosylformylglycinamidine synthase
MNPMSVVAADAFRSMGLNQTEYDLILRLMGREPNLTELGMFSVMWSEHCGYKYSRPVLSVFSRYKAAMEGEGHENAGVVPIDDKMGITMKVESHNHPSAVEPYQGAATGVGGIIRDIFTMGARPIASLNSLRFGPIEPGSAAPEVTARNLYLLRRVVAGIGGYGNCVGVPTVAGEISFHPRYSGNPLVNAMSVGIVPLDSVATAAAAGIGNPVIYMGSRTGRDGIHGATFASEALSEESDSKRPNVQIGDPFAEKLLIEATLEALATGALVAIQDMGAAGLTCSTVEMASKGNVGMEVDLDLVPMREGDMSAYELMLSESQERMLAVAHRGRENEVLDICHKWDLNAVVIGYVVAEPTITVRRHGKIEAVINPKWLTDHCPTYRTEPEVPDYYRQAQAWTAQGLPEVDLSKSLLRLLASPNIGSKRWAFEQYDQDVQTQTVFGPGEADAAVLAPRGTQKGIALKIDGNGRWVYFDPYVGGQLTVAEAARNVACTGALPVAATDGLNFGNPELGHVFWQFEQAVNGIAKACEKVGTPVISGNVSFYNQSELGEIYPTPMIGILGVMDDTTKAIGLSLPDGEGVLAVISVNAPISGAKGLGASEFLATIHGIEDGLPEAPDLSGERALHRVMVKLAEQGLVTAAHDVSDGGIAVTLAEMAIPNSVGVQVSFENDAYVSTIGDVPAAFGEFPGRIVIACTESSVKAVQAVVGEEGLYFYRLGTYTGGEKTFTAGKINVKLTDLRLAFERAIGNNMGEFASGQSF